MIKGDMVLTKPGQGRSNQKVTFIQKQVPMKPNELKNIGFKKTVLVSKEKLVSQAGTKFFATKDGKLLQIPMTSKSPVSPNVQISPTKTIVTQHIGLHQSVTQQQIVTQSSPIQQQPKITLSVGNSPIKIKPGDIKKEKRKSDSSIELLSKTEENSTKIAEIKTLDSQYFFTSLPTTVWN